MAKHKIKSDFAILDVKIGRAKLARHFEGRPAMGECPEKMRVPVVIHGYVDSVWGADDGTSQEFSVTVERIEVPT